MKVFVIGAVRGATNEWRSELERHVAKLEASGTTVHLPHRDTDQTATGIEICRQNLAAIASADEVHLFYRPDSQGTHFDMGCAFALSKPIRVIRPNECDGGKSFLRVAVEWAGRTTPYDIIDFESMDDATKRQIFSDAGLDWSTAVVGTASNKVGNNCK